MNEAMALIRDDLADIDVTEVAHLAVDAPSLDQIFSPRSHVGALDPSRSLVVGNRGVGKSFWSAVLAHEATRNHVANRYPRLHLETYKVELGFHEAAGKVEGFAPSALELSSLKNAGIDVDATWQAVLLRALGTVPVGGNDLAELSKWISANPLQFERLMREADAALGAQGERFLLIFDALDRLGRDWTTIRTLTRGLLRLALDVRGFRNIRVKLFMRIDQAADDSLFSFQDASKLLTEQVNLVWERRDLYGMIYQRLWSSENADLGFKKLLSSSLIATAREITMPDLLEQESLQSRVFYRIAGEFMGSDARRGRTYSWLHGHLADAFEQASPRSFLTALRTAAHSPAPSRTAIDSNGLKSGVQAASAVRVQQLKEDFDWIGSALRALQGLEVPCHPTAFIRRWKDRGTIAEIEAGLAQSEKLGPVEFELAPADKGSALLDSLETIGVIERRGDFSINMPDLFRVEAGIKRRGGVKPPAKPR